MKTNYQIGDRFKVIGWYEKYMLAQVGPGEVALIGLQSGNRFTDPITVSKNCYKINREEIGRLTNGDKFKRTDKAKDSRDYGE
jgi:hypothetical protein